MSNFSKSTGIAFAVVVVLAVACSAAQAEYVQSESLPEEAEGQIVKRPFCNSFTGCGRKRSGSEDADAEAAAFWQVFRQLIMRQARRQGLESRLDSLNSLRDSKNHLLGPYFDYAAERKKRMAPAYADHSFKDEGDDDNGAIYAH